MAITSQAGIRVIRVLDVDCVMRERLLIVWWRHLGVTRRDLDLT